MKNSVQLFKSLVNQDGSIVIFIALALVMLLGFAALAVDIGHITVTKNELQNISDAASLAATRKLGSNYENMPWEEQQIYVANPAELIAIAKDVGLKNQAGKMNITINDADVIIGTWNAQTKTPTPTLDQPDAVRVIARRSSSSAEGPISNIFAKILGRDTTNVEADATAALTGQSTAGEGGLPVPIGISARWFETPNFCNQSIRFYPTGSPDGCAGWTTYTDDFYDRRPPNTDKLRDIIDALGDGLRSPPATANETYFEFVGGNLANTLNNFRNLFNIMKVLNDGDLDADLDSTTWTTAVAVYSYEGLSTPCANPNIPLKILGFSTVTIFNVLAPPDGQLVEARVKCDYVEPARGGGGEYGTKGSIPGLVE